MGGPGEGQGLVLAPEGFEALYQMGPAGVAEIVKLLRDKEWTVRLNAAQWLAKAGPAGKAAIPALIELLQDEQGQVRANAGSALRSMGPAAKTAIPALKELLRHKDQGIRLEAAALLAGIDPGVKDSIPVLTEMLRDKDPQVRYVASGLLLLVDEKHGIATRIELLKDKKAGAGRAWVALELGSLGPKAKAAVPAIIELLRKRIQRIRP